MIIYSKEAIIEFISKIQALYNHMESYKDELIFACLACKSKYDSKYQELNSQVEHLKFLLHEAEQDETNDEYDKLQYDYESAVKELEQFDNLWYNYSDEITSAIEEIESKINLLSDIINKGNNKLQDYMAIMEQVKSILHNANYDATIPDVMPLQLKYKNKQRTAQSVNIFKNRPIESFRSSLGNRVEYVRGKGNYKYIRLIINGKKYNYHYNKSGINKAYKTAKKHNDVGITDYLNSFVSTINKGLIRVLVKSISSLFFKVVPTWLFSTHTTPTYMPKKSYWDKTVNHWLYGDFTNDCTGLGVAGDIGASLFGIDAPMDIRDMVANISKGEWGWAAFDAFSVLPGVGTVGAVGDAFKSIHKGAKIIEEAGDVLDATGAVIKNSDSIFDAGVTLGKNSDEFLDTVSSTAKNADDIEPIVNKRKIFNTNKEKGKKFNELLKSIAEKSDDVDFVANEVPINVEGGKQFRADLIVKKKDGSLMIIEGKSSITATYTKNQKIDFHINNTKPIKGKLTYDKLIGDAKFTKKGNNIFGDITLPEGTEVITVRDDNITEFLKLLNLF